MMLCLSQEDKYRSVSLMRAIDIFGEIAAEELTDEKNPTITVKENNLCECEDNK